MNQVASKVAGTVSEAVASVATQSKASTATLGCIKHIWLVLSNIFKIPSTYFTWSQDINSGGIDSGNELF